MVGEQVAEQKGETVKYKGKNVSDGGDDWYAALTQQHLLTVIWIVFRPGWHTCFR